MSVTLQSIEELSAAFERLSAREILQWAAVTFPQRVAVSTAFGPEGIVIVDIAQREVTPRIPVFTIDTGFLFPETQALIGKIENRYGISVERLYPRQLPPEELAARFRPETYLHRRDPDRCCHLRKVLPLRAKLPSLDALITGLRRSQSEARRTTAVIGLEETPDGHRYLKINPLATWSRQQVWDYIRANKLDYNVLHDRGYASIGCWPECCTRPVQRGEDERAGRWSGTAKTECGLHTFGRRVSESAYREPSVTKQPCAVAAADGSRGAAAFIQPML